MSKKQTIQCLKEWMISHNQKLVKNYERDLWLFPHLRKIFHTSSKQEIKKETPPPINNPITFLNDRRQVKNTTTTNRS